MMDFEQKTGTDRLADTLKRTGLASSAHDAKRMAEDITKTEKKVQYHFDEKSEELHEEMIKRVHGTPEQKTSKHPKLDVTVEDNLESQKLTSPNTPQIQQETPAVEAVEDEGDIFSSQKPLKEVLDQKPVSIEEKQEEQSRQAASLDKLEPVVEKEDFINQHIREEKGLLAVSAPPAPEKPQVEQQEPLPQPIQTEESALNKEEERPALIKEAPQEQEKQEDVNIDVNDYFNHAKKDMKPSERLAGQTEQQEEQKIAQEKASAEPQKTIKATSPQKEEPHPKTGDEQEVDLHQYFNFAKRGKI